MTLFRVNHSKNYTVINNTICTDKRLSWKAKGIWLYAFSRPDDWVFHLNDLINQSTDGKESVRSGIKELEKAGYLRRSQKRTDGKFGQADWDFNETPQETLKEKVPKSGNPSTAKTTTGNQPLLSTESKLSTKIDDDTPYPQGGGVAALDRDSKLTQEFLAAGYDKQEIVLALKKAKDYNVTDKGLKAYVNKILNSRNSDEPVTKPKAPGRARKSSSQPGFASKSDYLSGYSASYSPERGFSESFSSSRNTGIQMS